MKPHPQPPQSGCGGIGRSSPNGRRSYMSERQTQAYLMARDAIRRIQRTSSIVGSISKDAMRRPFSANSLRDSF